jgi:hypothetical protein
MAVLDLGIYRFTFAVFSPAIQISIRLQKTMPVQRLFHNLLDPKGFWIARGAFDPAIVLCVLHLQENSDIFSCRYRLEYMAQAIENKIEYRIRGSGGGWSFSPRDFLDLGHRPTVDSALHRLERKGSIRRVIRGIYDYPRFSKLLGQQLSPDLDQVATALARKFRWRIQPSGATALNFLGLSTQVPARAVYLSDGPDRVYQIGNTPLVFEHTALKESGTKLKESGLIVQALKSLGPERITPEIIAKTREWLPKPMRAKVLADTKTVTGWVYSAIQQIAGEDRHG